MLNQSLYSDMSTPAPRAGAPLVERRVILAVRIICHIAFNCCLIYKCVIHCTLLCQVRLNIVLYLVLARVLVSGKSVRCGVAALCETADMPTMRWTVWAMVCTLTHASQHAHTDIGIFMVKGGIK